MNLRDDRVVYNAIKKEKKRQKNNLEMIASENYTSKAVMQACGSILTNKYAEGYPGNRYYGGCEYVDEIERTAIERACDLFDAKYANVQPHSGSQANAAVYQALLKPGDKVLGMGLNAGGHLTHGYKLSFSGYYYDCYSYGVNEKTEMIDYDEVLKIAKEVKPKLIIAGASAYARKIDFKKFREIADGVGAYLLVDMAHIAGLVAAGQHMSPIEYAHVVTTTTHKTLRGPRGGLILTNYEDIAKKIDKAVFPGQQGGPLMHIIAGKAVCFGEALTPEYKKYIYKVVSNAKVLADEFIRKGYHVISNGTDNHLLLIDVKSKFNITGLEAEKVLESVNITLNKNSIPNDTEKPKYTSGIRIGTPALTTRGFEESEMILVSSLIDKALTYRNDPEKLKEVKKVVEELTRDFKIY